MEIAELLAARSAPFITKAQCIAELQRRTPDLLVSAVEAALAAFFQEISPEVYTWPAATARTLALGQPAPRNLPPVGALRKRQASPKAPANNKKRRAKPALLLDQPAAPLLDQSAPPDQPAPLLDQPAKLCSLCGASETPAWRHVDGAVTCNKCWCKYRRQKSQAAKRQATADEAN